MLRISPGTAPPQLGTLGPSRGANRRGATCRRTGRSSPASKWRPDVNDRGRWVASPLVAGCGPTFDRWKPSGVSDWRLAEPRADPLCCPLTEARTREMSILAYLLYGAGLRVLECCRLRVQGCSTRRSRASACSRVRRSPSVGARASLATGRSWGETTMGPSNRLLERAGSAGRLAPI